MFSALVSRIWERLSRKKRAKEIWSLISMTRMAQGNMTGCKSPHTLKLCMRRSASHQSQRSVWALAVAAGETDPCSVRILATPFPPFVVVSW